MLLTMPVYTNQVKVFGRRRRRRRRYGRLRCLLNKMLLLLLLLPLRRTLLRVGCLITWMVGCCSCCCCRCYSCCCCRCCYCLNCCLNDGLALWASYAMVFLGFYLTSCCTALTSDPLSATTAAAAAALNFIVGFVRACAQQVAGDYYHRNKKRMARFIFRL